MTNTQSKKPRSKPQYFVEVDTYYQNSSSFFIGPFDSREDAEKWSDADNWVPEDNVWSSSSTCWGDLRSAYRIYDRARSMTEARKRGLYLAGERDINYAGNVLPVTTKPNADMIYKAIRELYGELHDEEYD